MLVAAFESLRQDEEFARALRVPEVEEPTDHWH